MKGVIFMVIVTIVVLASFARPEKEMNAAPVPSVSGSRVSANNNTWMKDSSTVSYKKK